MSSKITHTLYLNLFHSNLYLRATWMWQSLPFPHMAYWPGHHNGKWGIVLLWYPQENSPVEKVRTQARSMHLGIALLLSVRDSERSHYSYYKHKSNFKKTMHIITKTRHELLGGKKKKTKMCFQAQYFWVDTLLQRSGTRTCQMLTGIQNQTRCLNSRITY